MNNKSLISTVIAAALGLSLVAVTPVHAQSPGGSPGMGQGPGGGRGATMLQRFDADSDGKISRKEYEEGRVQRFNQLDANHDGKVTLEEFQSQGWGRNPARKEAMFRQLDANHDGAITRDEFDKTSDARFDRLDLNHDGFIEQAELRQARQQKKQSQGAGSGQRMVPGGQGGQGMGPGPRTAPGTQGQ